MFRSTTIRLTVWYLVILMAISIAFSAIIYQVASSEVERRLERFQTTLQQQDTTISASAAASEAASPQDTTSISKDDSITPPKSATTTLKAYEENRAQISLLIQLAYINLLVLIIGGFASFFLARRHLRPIEEAHAAQSRFTSDASHELRTPLAAMRAEIEVTLKDKNSTKEEMREVLSSNLEEVKKLTKLSTMLLNLSRFDNKKLDLKQNDLNKITDSVIKDLRLPNNKIIVKKLFKHNVVHCDEMAIFDLIKILVDNAVKYSYEDSRIRISVTRDKDSARFEITNRGVGINKDDIEHIFDRFYRADSSRTHSGEQKSYGLGLALAKKIVDLHKGTLSVKSTPNKTTTFTFSLPLNNKIKAKNQK